MSKRVDLSCLPAVNEIMRDGDLAEYTCELPRQQVVETIRDVVASFRQRLEQHQAPELANDPHRLYQLVVQQAVQLLSREQCRKLQPVINATGVLLHTNLGRAPLAEEALARLNQTAGYSNLETDLTSGTRSHRGERATRLLARLTGAEDAVVVNNCAAATVLVLHALAVNREVIVSRGQLVEIGGGFRLPEVFTAAGVRLREVGTTNRTYVRDYLDVLGEQTGAIIRVHRSNFSMSGFVAEPSIAELASLERPPEIPVIDDLGSGLVTDLSALGISEPTVQESVAAGADVCLFSGDKLFGGPQCGIIVGKRKWTQRLKSSPFMRAMRTDKLTLAALEATTEIHLSGNARIRLPLFRLLYTKPSDIQERCRAVREQLGDSANQVTIVSCRSRIGGGSLPGLELPSFGLRLRFASAQKLASRLRLGKPAVQGRVSDQHLLLDLRTVSDAELPSLVQRLREVLTETQSQDSDWRQSRATDRSLHQSRNPRREETEYAAHYPQNHASQDQESQDLG